MRAEQIVRIRKMISNLVTCKLKIRLVKILGLIVLELVFLFA